MTRPSPPSAWATPAKLRAYVADIFGALGLERDAAMIVADALVEADCEGISSHGVMLVPLYVERIRAGSVSLAAAGTIVSDRGAAVVIDAGNALGQLTARQAVDLLVARAPRYGFAAAAIRNAFHFGTAGRWARALAERGLIGVVMSNTRPLMPAPGGAERVVGNNPLAIAMPSAGGCPVVFDMATSASAMGKIRLADAAGQKIPDDWATDAQGRPTTDPAEAIKGMLLPAAGPKGFGLAFMIDLFCGGLSSGAVGDAVRPLYGNPAEPYGCAHFFLAISIEHFRDLPGFSAQVAQLAERVRNSARAPGTSRLYSPGDPARLAKEANAEACPVAAEVALKLEDIGAGLGLSGAGVFRYRDNKGDADA
ncbi:MAG TPA: Ldh family oxidoreductase [Alphaproteobacteria bacterium]|nr:Ldh family oxidoreductase [Alphaproteobacteria bacterium]